MIQTNMWTTPTMNQFDIFLFHLTNIVLSPVVIYKSNPLFFYYGTDNYFSYPAIADTYGFNHV